MAQFNKKTCVSSEENSDIFCKYFLLEEKMNENVIAKFQELLDEMRNTPSFDEKTGHATRNLKTEEAVKRVEERVLGRFQVSENYLVNQFEELSVAMTFIIVAATLMCFYVFYQLMMKVMYVNRCRCSERFTDWDSVVKASKQVLLDAEVRARIPNPPPQVPEECKSS